MSIAQHYECKYDQFYFPQIIKLRTSIKQEFLIINNKSLKNETSALINNETSALINIWADENVQKLLDGAARNQVVYVKISINLSQIGFNTKSWKQCRTKIKNLIQAYRKVKDSNGRSGRGRKKEHFSAIDSVLGTRPASRPKIVVMN